MNPDPRRLKVGAAIVALYVIWGSTYLALRFGLEGGFTPFLMGGLRFTIAGAALYGWARRRGNPLPTRLEWRNAAFIGGLLLVGGVGLVTIAEDNGVGSGVVATAVAAMPLWMAVLGFGFGSRPRRLEWIGLLVGFGGVVILSFESDFATTTLGLVLVIVSPIFWALGSVLSGHLLLPRGMMGTSAQLLTGGLLLAVAGLARGERISTMPTPGAWAAVGYLIVLGSVIAFGAYMYLLVNVRPAVASSYAYVNPAVAVLLGVTLGSETVSGWTLAGLPVILLGVAVVGLAQRRKQETP
ncbi:MAG: drug/metabolite exporter YedA [Acidimicrobiia bacterium]|nr:drug/metabolite exporter YedA [Acidimicrobiia bacterium]